MSFNTLLRGPAGYLVAAVISTMMLGSGHAQAQDVEGIAVVVNDEIISLLDMEKRMRLFTSSLGVEDSLDIRDQIRPQVIQSLIDERLQAQVAEELGVVVGQYEVDAAIAKIAESNGFTGSDVDVFFRTQNIDISALEQQIRARLLWSRIIESEIATRVDVSPDEVSEIVERTKLNSGQPEYLIAEIFLPVDAPSSQSSVKVAADRLLESVRQTGDFAEVAHKFSQAASATRGGDLGWVKNGDVDDAVWQELSRMATGEVSKPIRTRGGYSLVLLRDSRVTGENMNEELSLKQILFRQDDTSSDESVPQASESAAQVAALLREGAGENVCDDIDMDLVSRNGGAVNDLGTLVLRDLPSDIRRAVAPLGVGTLAHRSTARRG